MDLKQKLEADLINALRAGEELRKRTIRMIIAAIKLAQVDKGGPLDDASILSIIQKEIKNRKDAAEEAQKVNRIDLIAENHKEIQVLEAYLPKQLSEDELKALIQAAIKEADAYGPADMGKVMKSLMPKIQGRAPGDIISALVRQILQG